MKCRFLGLLAIAQISLRSPHSFFFVEAKDDKGVVQRWAFKGPPPASWPTRVSPARRSRLGDPVSVIANP
jgi:hypothetical protein